jgi:hypothetical protein
MGIKICNEAVMRCFPPFGKTAVGRVFDGRFCVKSRTAATRIREFLFHSVSRSHEIILEIYFDYTFGGVGGGVSGPRLLVWGYLLSSSILCATIASWPLTNS